MTNVSVCAPPVPYVRLGGFSGQVGCRRRAVQTVKYHNSKLRARPETPAYDAESSRPGAFCCRLAIRFWGEGRLNKHPNEVNSDEHMLKMFACRLLASRTTWNTSETCLRYFQLQSRLSGWCSK